MSAGKFASIVSKHIAAIVAVMMWGLSFVSTKVIMQPEGPLSPTEAFVYRFTIAYLILLAFKHKQIRCHTLHDELLMLLCGIFSGSLYFIAENTALQYTLAANVSLLTATAPLITVLIVGLMYRSERPGRGMIIGSLVAFAGVTLVIFNSSTSIEVKPLGDMLSIAAAVCWAVYSLILRKLNVVYDALFITRKTFFYGVVTALPFLAFEPRLANPIEVFGNPVVFGNLAFLTLGASLLGFFLWAKAVKKLGAVSANNYLYFQPVITLVASAIVLGERISAIGYCGFATILLGLWLGDYLQRQRR